MTLQSQLMLLLNKISSEGLLLPLTTNSNVRYSFEFLNKGVFLFVSLKSVRNVVFRNLNVVVGSNH